MLFVPLMALWRRSWMAEPRYRWWPPPFSYHWSSLSVAAVVGDYSIEKKPRTALTTTCWMSNWTWPILRGSLCFELNWSTNQPSSEDDAVAVVVEEEDDDCDDDDDAM
jgi:hypothetical protein